MSADEKVMIETINDLFGKPLTERQRALQATWERDVYHPAVQDAAIKLKSKLSDHPYIGRRAREITEITGVEMTFWRNYVFCTYASCELPVPPDFGEL
jgi:hypothetical protein